jgi:transposase
VGAGLVAAGYQVYAVNPRQAARFKERYGTSGAKSDKGDAHALADMVRIDRAQLRPIAGDSEQAQAVKVVARAHQTLIWERTGPSSGCAARCGSTSPARSPPTPAWS